MNEATFQAMNPGPLDPRAALDPTGLWYAEANPDLDHDEGGAAKEPDTPSGDVDHPVDPPGPRADLPYDDGEPATEPPAPDPDKDHPGDPPPPEVAQNNGR